MFEKKGNLDYLPWSIAWQLLKSEFSTADYRVVRNEQDNINYFTDGRTSYVTVEVTAWGVTHQVDLPITDFKNNSIILDKMTSVDVNNTIQRALTKGIALHGIGLNAWTGSDDQKQVMDDKEFAAFLDSANKKDVVDAYATIEFTSEQKKLIKTKFK